MQKLILIGITAWVMFFSCSSKPVSDTPKLQWMSLKEVELAMQKEKRPILIDLYTDWCGWCKVMDKKTYTNKKVIEYLQGKFYPVKLDAETREKISWNGKNYSFNSAYKTNEIALYLTSGQLSYPTTVIIPLDGSGPQPIPGFLEPKDLELIVKYFGEDKYGKVPFEQYQKGFKTSW